MWRAPAPKLVVSAVLALCTAVALSWSARRRGDRVDVILISLDSLRKDALGAYRTDGASLTPALDRLARRSVLFTRAFTPVAFTLPSHMSMFTGLRPWAHGVVSDSDRLGDGIATLPERLRSAGYRTLGFYSNEFVGGGFGFARGFDRYVEVVHDLTSAARVTSRALSAVDWSDPRRPPVFLFLHYYEAHSDADLEGNGLPYYSPPALREGLPVSREGREFCDGRGRCASAFLVAADLERRSLPPETVRLVRALYERGVRHLDGELDRLFRGLDEAGALDRAVVAVTSDHGEEFREHGRFMHSQVYEETIAVPLLLHLPGGAHSGKVREELVELTDLLPTLLGAVGRPDLVPSGLDGRSLLSAGPEAADPRRTVLSRDKERPDRWALRTDRYKLIHDFSGENAELYDLDRDPAESEDLGTSHRDVARRLDEHLSAALAEIRPSDWADPSSRVLSEEQKSRLRAIGYLH